MILSCFSNKTSLFIEIWTMLFHTVTDVNFTWKTWSFFLVRFKDCIKNWKCLIGHAYCILFIYCIFIPFIVRKHPSRGVLIKSCSDNMQQIYKRTSMPRFDFNKVALHLYWNRTLATLLKSHFGMDVLL